MHFFYYKIRFLIGYIERSFPSPCNRKLILHELGSSYKYSQAYLFLEKSRKNGIFLR